jgi:hypothetical protein
MKTKKKKKPARKVKEKELTLSYSGRALPFTEAHEFTFEPGKPMGNLRIVVVAISGVGTVVFARDGDLDVPRFCWIYKSGTTMKEAVSKAFRQILEQACEQMIAMEKVAKVKA